ncbi:MULTISPECIES: GYD domain-containing protein [Halobacterium]|uniref:GYD domain-containing protein n=1 Tax=Halobacterium TaxID=2239 RepID=UPI00073E1712|nr:MULTISPECIES: GYD domain-containing protein [Halobacterium]MCG1002243.1 GYD domain-containing protein [Halobacterium noricense]
MPTYAAIANIETGQFQNAQELSAIWGDVRADLESQDCTLQDAYVLLGERDVLLVFDAPDREAALQASIAAERYGIDMQTMEAMDVEKLGEVVEDL